MQMRKVESSNIAALGHEPVRKTLAVEFKGRGDEPGPIWEYWPVSLTEWVAINQPGPEHNHSVGKAFHAIVKTAVRAGTKQERRIR